MVVLPDFEFHLKSGQFANQPLFDRSKSRFQIPTARTNLVALYIDEGVYK